ncbi:unnamed protein product [Diabrotica balteata]|uniref:Myb/SANT-like DNA-binding domain-containing protein n=1 Tax=Diabrotica balteata TaxID=107213 RepID=A0A9N9XBA3_DIABA|nr:unnamed protein product [Diabrotica balteata]
MAHLFENIYFYNGFNYKIIETEEIHNLLGDVNYFENYILENSNCIEIQSAEDDVKENKVEPFLWNPQGTKLLLQAYLDKRDLFRDPKIKKKELWGQIRAIFKNHGYIVTEDILDKKFRNMKCHYKTIKDNNKKTKTGQGRVKWEYFDIMDNIFQEDKTINPDEVLSSMSLNLLHVYNKPIKRKLNELKSLPTIPKSLNDDPQPITGKMVSIDDPQPSTNKLVRIDDPQPSTSKMVRIDDPQPSTSKLVKIDDTTLNTPTTKKSLQNQLKSSEGKKLYKLRQNMAELENRRVLALEKIARELEENNKIQRERNNLIKQHLNVDKSL